MSERRRRYGIYEIDRSDPVIEERRPERARSPVTLRRRTIIFTSTPVHSRRKERVERSPSPVRYVRRPRAPTPPPRSYTPPPTIIMPPKQTPALKPILTSRTLASKKDDNKLKSGTKPSDKANDGPRVKIYEKGHKPYNSLDSGHASGFSSPWSVEERSPLDYAGASIVPTTTPVPKSPKPRVDREPYEIITADSRPRYIKTSSDRSRGTPTTTERKKDARYVIRTPDSPGFEAEIVPTPAAKPSKVSKDGYAPTQRATQVLQEQLAKEPERTIRPKETSRLGDSQRVAEKRLKQLEADFQKVRLEQQIAEGRAAEAERRLKQQRAEDLERRGEDLKQQAAQAQAQAQAQAEEKRKREASLARREAILAKQQWEEIEATPPSSAVSSRRAAPLVEQGQVSRRHTLMTPYGSGTGVLTTTTTAGQPPSFLETENPFLAPILEAQRDEDARRAREAKDGRRGMVIKETARSTRSKRRDGDDRYHF